MKKIPRPERSDAEATREAWEKATYEKVKRATELFQKQNNGND